MPGPHVALVLAVRTVPGIVPDKKKVKHLVPFISSVSLGACQSAKCHTLYILPDLMLKKF